MCKKKWVESRTSSQKLIDRLATGRKSNEMKIQSSEKLVFITFLPAVPFLFSPSVISCSKTGNYVDCDSNYYSPNCLPCQNISIGHLERKINSKINRKFLIDIDLFCIVSALISIWISKKKKRGENGTFESINVQNWQTQHRRCVKYVD